MNIMQGCVYTGGTGGDIWSARGVIRVYDAGEAIRVEFEHIQRGSGAYKAGDVLYSSFARWAKVEMSGDEILSLLNAPAYKDGTPIREGDNVFLPWRNAYGVVVRCPCKGIRGGFFRGLRWTSILGPRPYIAPGVDIRIAAEMDTRLDQRLWADQDKIRALMPTCRRLT